MTAVTEWAYRRLDWMPARWIQLCGGLLSGIAPFKICSGPEVGGLLLVIHSIWVGRSLPFCWYHAHYHSSKTAGEHLVLVMESDTYCPTLIFTTACVLTSGIRTCTMNAKNQRHKIFFYCFNWTTPKQCTTRIVHTQLTLAMLSVLWTFCYWKWNCWLIWPEGHHTWGKTGDRVHMAQSLRGTHNNVFWVGCQLNWFCNRQWSSLNYLQCVCTLLWDCSQMCRIVLNKTSSDFSGEWILTNLNTSDWLLHSSNLQKCLWLAKLPKAAKTHCKQKLWCFPKRQHKYALDCQNSSYGCYARTRPGLG